MRQQTRRRFLQYGAAGGLLAAFGQPRGAAAQATISPAERAAMAASAATYLDSHGVPGVSVAIARHGSLVYAEGFGLADAKTGEKVTPASLFRIASVSKPLTAVAIFTLIEQGRLRLDDKVFGGAGILRADYGKPPYGPHIEDITVEHLLTHTSGGWPNDGTDPMFSNPQMNHQQLIAWTLANRPLKNPPGVAHAYSNFGYCVLGRVIEKVTRQSYADYVRTGVLSRCGVTQMRLAGNTLAQRASGEVVYAGQDGGAPYGMNVTRMDAHGGWIANASDLVRLATHVDGFANTPDILQPATIETMTTPSPVNRNYAKGWSTNGRNWWHTGSLPGTSAIMVRTASGLCWAGLANSRRKDPESVAGLDRLMWQMVRAVKSWSA